MAKEVFEAMTATGKSAKDIVAEKGLGQISDTGELEAIVARLVAANPGPAEEFRQGRDRVLGFFVGQVMKETRGQANPQLVNELLRKHLGAARRMTGAVRRGRPPGAPQICEGPRKVENRAHLWYLALPFRNGSDASEEGCKRRAIHRCAPGIVPCSQDRGHHLGQVDSPHPPRPFQGINRFSALERSLVGISPKTLSERLKALEKAGDRHAQELRGGPARVEYTLTEHGTGSYPSDRPHARLREQVAR